MSQQKKVMADGINKQKKQIAQKFEDTMKKNQQITPEMILQMFPGEEGNIMLERINAIKNESTLKKTKKSGTIDPNSFYKQTNKAEIFK